MKAGDYVIVNAKAFDGHRAQYAERIFQNLFLVGKAENAQSTGQWKASLLCNLSSVPFIKDDKIGGFFFGQLYGFGFAPVQPCNKVGSNGACQGIYRKPSGIV